MARIDESRSFIPVRIAVLTVSDTRSLADDKSGQTLADRITEAGHMLAARDIVTDDREKSATRFWRGRGTRISMSSSPPAAPVSPAVT